MRQTDALARFILCAGAAKKVENALVIRRVDAAAIVGYLVDREARRGVALDSNISGDARLEIFQGIVEQVGKNLLQRKPVADYGRQGRDPDLRIGFEAHVARQHLRDLGQAAVEGLDDRVDLHAVAGGDEHRLGDVLAGEEVVQDLRRVLGGHRDALEDGHLGGAVRDADQQEAHR